MCGIAGIINGGNEHLLAGMSDVIAHRGPDGAGLFLGPGVGLAHRRLSIVDLAQGQQPMYSYDRRFVLVYNGEVFNHPTLKPELEAAGVRYRTRSDTETVLHLYERLGERAVEQGGRLWDEFVRAARQSSSRPTGSPPARASSSRKTSPGLKRPST